MWKAVVFFGVFALVSSQTTDVSQCTANAGSLPVHVYINDCITPPCVFYQQEHAVVNVVFQAPRTIRRMRTLATAYMQVGPITLPIAYDLQEQALTCNYLTNTYCPVMESEVIQYQLLMYIESWFPAGTQVNIEFRVVDDDTAAQEPILCIRSAIRIAGARTRSLTAANVTDTTLP